MGTSTLNHLTNLDALYVRYAAWLWRGFAKHVNLDVLSTVEVQSILCYGSTACLRLRKLNQISYAAK